MLSTEALIFSNDQTLVYLITRPVHTPGYGGRYAYPGYGYTGPPRAAECLRAGNIDEMIARDPVL